MFLWLKQIDEWREYFRVNVKILTLDWCFYRVIALAFNEAKCYFFMLNAI